jgi:hypothetical protein
VYLIDQEGRAQVRPVKVARQIGSEVVIASGVRGGDQVITEIPQALQEGTRVRVSGVRGVADGDKSDRKGKKSKGKGDGAASAGSKG